LTGKKANIANNVSHAHNKTKKRQNPNIQTKRIFVPEKGRHIKLTLSTRAIRSINKVGLRAFCGKLGVNYDALLRNKTARS
ncbi:MAG: large subunit ribosomal protein L28, partial [Myxococcota bacterium]